MNTPRSTSPHAPRSRFAAGVFAAMLAAVGSSSAFADDATWNGATDNAWATDSNWSAAPVPGAGNVATFSDAGNGNTTIDLGTGVTVGQIVFDTASVGAYTIGSGGVGAQTLTLGTTTGLQNLSLTATVANDQVVNANIVSTITDGTLRFSNASASTLTLNGTITGTTGTLKTINFATTSGGGDVVFNGTISNGSSTSSAPNVANTGTGSLTLAGSGSFTLNTLRATADGSSITVDNADANITVVSSSSYGAGSSGPSNFILTAGTVAFNGGLTNNKNNGDGGAFIINGGTFSASSISMVRTGTLAGNSSGATITTAKSTSAGFQVNGGTATVTGDVNLAGSNSAANGQVSGTGSLTIGGELILGAANNTRTTVFQVTGGTLTDTDTVGNGIVIGKGTTSNASSGELLLTGGTTTTEKITFGLNGGAAGSYGNLTMNGADAHLYVGSGGIVLAATDTYTSSIRLMNGTLGAKADWSSSMDMALADSGVTIKAADASGVAHDITLSGVLSGANGFTKTGDGTLTLSGVNTYTGPTVINEGVLSLGVAGAIASGGAITLGGGTLDAGAFSNSLGALALTANSAITLDSYFGTLAFADSSALDWGTYTLSITGTFLDGSSVQFGDDASGLTADQLARITVNGSAVALDSNGYLMAIPEPAACAALAGLLALGLASRRRRA